jgi:hypothetical protein
MSAMKEMHFEANEKFYEWESFKFGNKSPLSDDDRLLWIEGYMFGYASKLGDEIELPEELR